jgi:erythromycin esterase-like protein
VRDLRTTYTALGQAHDRALANTMQRLVRLSDELAQHLQAVAAPAALQQYAQVLRQQADLQWSNELRDQQMADNVAWLLRQEPAVKVVVWAHNIYIRRDEDQPRMGQLLSKQLGLAYVAVGFATGHGTASFFNSDTSVPSC